MIIIRNALLTLLLLSVNFIFSQNINDLDPTRFQNEIDNYKSWDSKNSPPENPVLFIGSSSIRLWKTHDAFPDKPIVNRGFGGAHISDMIYFYDHIAKPYNPELIMFYCGENDIYHGKPTDQVFEDFKLFAEHCTTDFPKVMFIYLAIKPSENRWAFYPKMKKFDQEVAKYCESRERFYYIDTASPMLLTDGKPNAELFLEDKLHLNEKGYKNWNNLLGDLFLKLKAK